MCFDDHANIRNSIDGCKGIRPGPNRSDQKFQSRSSSRAFNSFDSSIECYLNYLIQIPLSREQLTDISRPEKTNNSIAYACFPCCSKNASSEVKASNHAPRYQGQYTALHLSCISSRSYTGISTQSQQSKPRLCLWLHVLHIAALSGLPIVTRLAYCSSPALTYPSQPRQSFIGSMPLIRIVRTQRTPLHRRWRRRFWLARPARRRRRRSLLRR